MSLTDFVWDDEVTIKNGVEVIAGTAKAPDGRIIDVAISIEALEALAKDNLSKSNPPS